MANRKDHEHDYAETEVLPSYMRPDRVEALHDAAAEAHGRYQEYVRSLDEVPFLVDVVSEPPHVVTKDFGLGQRRDARKAARDDAAALREQHTRDVAQRYAEYVAIDASPATTERAPPHQLGGEGAQVGAAQKKRAKRVERSARSKS
jgi:N-acyl-D-aspartate/D-glutamate deacylase